MSTRKRNFLRAAQLASVCLLVLCAVRVRGTSANTQDNSVQPSSKNLQVLQAIAPDQLLPAMQFMSASLGVECEFCHVRDAYDKDDKPSKQTARRMIHMMFAINADQFHGQRAVTCYTCHRGSATPVSIPMVNSTAPYV